MPSINTSQKKADKSERWVFDVSDYISHAAWSNDSLFFAVALASGPIRIFNRKDGSQKTIDGHKFGTMEVSWSQDNSKIASAGQDGQLKIWDVTTQKLLKSSEAGSQWVEHITWSPDGNHIASAAGKILKVWNANGEMIQEYREHPSTITALHWNSTGKEIATASYGKIMIFQIGKIEPQQILLYPSSLISLSWHTSGKWIVAGTQEGSVHGWKIPHKEGNDIDIQGYETKITQLSWSKNGKYLATVGGSWIVIWDFSGKGPQGQKPEILKDQRKVTQMSYQNNGDLLVSGTKDGAVLFWRQTVPEKTRLEKHVGSPINHIRWSPDGSSLAICTDDGKIRIWDSPTV
ncbi:MAG: hypothetical protein FJ354_02695 [Thaumarchaeota archaeon]|nr:hypothetical protein [Nitrososphaerota archaeon]